MAEKLFSTIELGELVGLPRQTINYFVKEKRFPNHQRVGRNYGVPASDALDFIKEEIEKREAKIKKLNAEIETFRNARRVIESLDG